MTRICVIGNSHIAALMLGWKQMECDYPSTRFTFFGAPGTQMRNLKISPGSLVPTTAELREHIMRTGSNAEIKGDYDIFLICGLQFNAVQIAPLYAEYRAEAFAKDSRTPISDECFVRSLQGCLGGTLAVKTITKLHQVTSAPIALIPQPFPGEMVNGSLLFGNVRDNRSGESIAKLFDTACRRLARDLDVQIVFQPEFTKSGPLHTKAAYSAGSIKFGDLNTKLPKHESMHMNVDYGVVMLREVLSSLDIEKRASDSIS